MAASEQEQEIRELREIVQDYNPGKNVTTPDKKNIAFPENLIIGLFGRTGCGKSSLINSLKFAAQGRLRKNQWIAVASQEKAGGHTMFRKIADLTNTIFVIDNRGLDDPDAEKARIEMAAQLDGQRGYSEQVQWLGDEEGQGIDSSTVNVRQGHPITCVIFVFSAMHDIKSDFAGLNYLVDFLHRHQGGYPIAVITHVDVAERNKIDVLHAVLRVSGISDIYEVANVTNQKTKLDEEYQLNLLMLLERCMKIGDDTAVFKHYQRAEMEQKAKMVEQAAKCRASQKTRVLESRVTSADGSQEGSGLHQTDVERREVDKIKYNLGQRQVDLEFMERDHRMRMEVEQLRHQLQVEREQIESRERRLQEEERERRFQEELRRLEADKHAELARIMEVNRNQNSRGFHIRADIALPIPEKCVIQ